MSIQVKELEKLLKDSAISNKEGFLELYQKFVNKTNERAVFQGLENHQTFHYDKLGEAKKIPELLKQTVVCRLNGGLGTTLGSSLPKFSIPVKNKKTFLASFLVSSKTKKPLYSTFPKIGNHHWYAFISKGGLALTAKLILFFSVW